MYSYRLKSFLGTLLFSGLFLGICYIVIQYIPEDSAEKSESTVSATPSTTIQRKINKAIENPTTLFVPAKKQGTDFSTYSLAQNAVSAVTLAENLNLSGIDLLSSAGFEVAFDSKSTEKIESKTSYNDDYSAAEDSGLALYRQPQSRPAVEWFYTHITNNREVAQAILEYADKNDISPSLAFSLAYVESRFKTTAINHNLNETIDRGLFQLNSATFPKLTESDFFDPRISAKYGMTHLRYCMDIAGNEITALAMYNAGAAKVKSNNTPQQTLNYVAKISKYRKSLESQFSTEVLAFYDSSAKEKALAMLN